MPEGTRAPYIYLVQMDIPAEHEADFNRVYDTEHVPILYIEMDTYLPKLKLPPDARSKLMYGTHHIAGRIIDIPCKGDYGEGMALPAGPVPENTGLAGLQKLGYAGSLTLGSWQSDVMSHGGGREPALPANPAEREEWGKQGEAQLRAIVKQMHLPEAMEDLKKHDQYTNQILMPKFGKIVPAAH